MATLKIQQLSSLNWRLQGSIHSKLSKGNVVERVFELRDELKFFWEMQGKHDFMIHFIDGCWIQRTAYLWDIFGQLNKLNLKLQGKNLHIIHFRYNLQTFVSKLENWRRETNLGNNAVFDYLCTQLKHLRQEYLWRI